MNMGLLLIPTEISINMTVHLNNLHSFGISILYHRNSKNDKGFNGRLWSQLFESSRMIINQKQAKGYLVLHQLVLGQDSTSREIIES